MGKEGKGETRKEKGGRKGREKEGKGGFSPSNEKIIPAPLIVVVIIVTEIPPCLSPKRQSSFGNRA